jgi:hypothetical protein
MTINIFNDEPKGGAYIFPVFTTGGAHFSDELKAWFCKDGPYTTTKLSRIYINPTTGIAPGQSVTLQIPLYTRVMENRVLPDTYIDWWTGDTIELFFGTSAGPPRALTELLRGADPNNPNQTQLPNQSGLPTCNSCQMQFFVDTASIAKSNPSQLVEFNLGALQSLAPCSGPPDANNPACKNRPAGIPNALDTRNVDIDMSYVNVAFGPATLAPFQNDQTGYVGTPQPAENFSPALNKFIASSSACQGQSSSSCNGWPQFFHTYSDKTKEVLLKLASPLEAFARLTPPSKIPPPDLCGFDPAAPCSTPTGTLKWPDPSDPAAGFALWPPIQALLVNWISHAGTLKNYPDTPQTTIPPNLPAGTCGTAPTPGTFCAAIMDVKALIIRNYNNYVFLANQKRCATVPLNDFTTIAHLYGWSPFVETSGQGAPPCLGASDNLLQNTPFTAGQPCPPTRTDNCGYAANNFALYQQVKLEFDQLNYNLLTDNANPYNFNPWVNMLIHGSNFVNAPNVYAYSVDDAVGNLQSEGGGFIIDVGSSKNLCTGATPCSNQNPAGPPININLALNFSNPGNINFTNYGLCTSDPLSFKAVNTLSKSFIINASSPSQCPVFLVDSNSSPQLYTFTVTTPPAQAPKIPPPYILVPPGTASSSQTAKVIDCSGNKTFPMSSQVWCCKTRPNNLILGAWASSKQDTTSPHNSFNHFITTNLACPVGSDPNGNCSLNPGEQICSLGCPLTNPNCN